MAKDATAWAYVMVQFSIPVQVDDEVMHEFGNWFGRKYPNTQRNANGWYRESEAFDGFMTIVRFSIHPRHNPHHVAKKAEKKLNKLLGGV